MSSSLPPPVALLWIAGTATLLLLGIGDWMTMPEGSRLQPPETPVDLTNSIFADQWRFLALAKPYLPPDARVTFLGPDRDADMSLFMMALGMMTEFRALPFSYFHDPKPEYSWQADYLLVYRRALPNPALRLVKTLQDGAIYRRVRQ